ncbi:MAG: thioredoxin family protein [Nannocystaceae bacterium]|nr:thioredoxin family protein [bacterium]
MRRRRPHRLVFAVLLVLACGTQEAPATKAEDAPTAEEAGQKEAPQARAEDAEDLAPGVQADGTVVSAVDWFHGSLEEARAQAKSEGKLVFVDVGAYWCPPCQKLDEEVFTQASVGEALGDRYVAVHVDAEKAEGPDIVREHHVQAYPTILVLEPSGVEKGRVVDFLPASELLTALRRIEEGQSVLADAIEAVEAKPDDVAARQRLGHLYVLAGSRDEAEAEFEQVMEADPNGEMGLAPKVAYDRAFFILYKLDGDAPGAIASLRALQTQFPDSPEAVRAHRHIGRMLCGLGKEDEAIAALDAMLATDPDDTGLASSYGWFSFRQRCKPDRGLEVVRKALEGEPKNADLLYLEAELAALTGDREAAKAAIRKASEVEPDSAFLRRQIQRFEAAP